MTRARRPHGATLPIGALSELPSLMQVLGQDPWPLLRRFGLVKASFAEPHLPLPAVLHGSILEAAATATGCPHLGLLLGARATLDNVGELRFLLLSAASAGQALEHLSRFAPLMHRALESEITHDGGYASLSLGLIESTPGADQLLICYIAAIIEALRSVISPAWNPGLIHLALRRPREDEAYRHFFRAPVLYDQPEYAIYLPDAALIAPRAGSDPRLAAFVFERLCALEAEAPGDFIARVRHAIEAQLLHGHCDAQHIAGLFTVHRKTLHGYLREAGTSFSELREEKRRELAMRLLEHTSLPVADIATALGYRNQASVTRAFHRWHGCSPRSWRARTTGQAGIRRADRRRRR